MPGVKGQPTSPGTRARIIADREKGESWKALAKKYNRSMSTVRLIFNQYSNEDAAKNSPLRRPPRKLSDDDERRMVELATQEPSISY